MPGSQARGKLGIWEAPGIAEEGGPGLPLETSCDRATKEAGRVPACDLGLSTVKISLTLLQPVGFKFYPPGFSVNPFRKKKKSEFCLYQFSLALWETQSPPFLHPI